MNKKNAVSSEDREQTKPIIRSLFFTCGNVISKDVIIIPGGYNAYPDVDASRVVLKFAEEWFHHDVDTDLIVSVSFDPANQTVYLMGRHGLIRKRGGTGAPFDLQILSSTKFEEERIETEDYGLLYCIRQIGGDLYACGQSSQVYRRKGGLWGHIDKEILSASAPTLESIDGTGSDDIYAVGQKGTVLHFNGSRWSKIDLPTNRPLSTVRCVSKNEVYICGNNGLFFRGYSNVWEDLTDESKPYNYWDAEIFHECVYLSHHVGIVVFDGKSLSDVDFSVKKKVSCHKLHANDGFLWSFGVDDLMSFDGSEWTEILCPENAA